MYCPGTTAEKSRDAPGPLCQVPVPRPSLRLHARQQHEITMFSSLIVTRFLISISGGGLEFGSSIYTLHKVSSWLKT